MNEATPTPTEKSQIVISWNNPSQALVIRFSSVKKGQKEYKEFYRAWEKWAGNQSVRLHNVEGDMFVAIVDLSSITSIAFVDHSIRAKFVPQ